MSDAKNTLLKLLQQNREEFHVNYHGYLSNHLPMALISLFEMGATSQRLHDYANSYTARLEPSIPSMNFINSSNWKNYLGTNHFLKDYREFFASEKERLITFKALLKEYLPILIPGCVGGAFHPLLYLGYGCEILGIDGGNLLLDGLAYMAHDYTPIGTQPMSFKRTSTTVQQVFEAIVEDHPKNELYADRRIRFPAKLDLFSTTEPDELNNFDTLDITVENADEIMDEIATVMVGLYSTTADFFILHGVTSCFALKLVLEMVSPEEKPFIIRCYLRALMTTYIIQNQPPLEFASLNAVRTQLNFTTWEQLLFCGMTSQDEHVIKFVWTCWKENKMKPNSMYLLCASQKLGRIDPENRDYVYWPWAVAGMAAFTGAVKYNLR